MIVGAGACLPGQLVTFPEWPHRIIVETVPNPGQIVFEANRFYQRPAEFSVPVYQLSNDDEAGRFPGRRATPPRRSSPDRAPSPRDVCGDMEVSPRAT